jgi:hypothetical protein
LPPVAKLAPLVLLGVLKKVPPTPLPAALALPAAPLQLPKGGVASSLSAQPLRATQALNVITRSTDRVVLLDRRMRGRPASDVPALQAGV